MEALGNKQTSKLNVSPGVIATMVTYIFATGLVLASEYRDYPELHTLLDASMFLLSGILALFFWNMSVSQARLPSLIAVSFALTFVLEFIHAVTGLEWSGSLAFINQQVNVLRPGTWPPPTYLLPIGVGYSIWTLRHDMKQKYVSGFTLMLIILSIVLLAVFDKLPRYTDPTWLGITRPTLIPVPLLWITIGLACWQIHTKDRILPALLWMATVLVVGNVFMLYSRAPHDTLAMVAHLGKMGGYLILLLSMMEMASTDLVQRIRAEEKFRGLNVDLEQRIVERTAQLEAEVAERKQSDLVRQKTQTVLNLTEQRLRALLENSWDAIALFGADGTILYGSPSTVQILGYTLDEFVGRNAFELIHTEDQVLVTERMTMSLQQPGVHVPVYARVLHKNGQWRWLEGVFTNLLDEPSVQAIVNNYHDFTERKQAEEKIAYQAYLLENVNDAVIGSDENTLIRFWNQGAERIFGWKEEEVLGRSGQEFLRSDFFNTDRESVLKMLSAQGRWRGETISYRKDGSQVNLEVSSITLRDAHGLITGYASVNRDITERKQAEEALRASEERFARAFRSSPTAITITLIQDGKFIDVNEAACQIFGCTHEQLIGRTSVELGIINQVAREKIMDEVRAKGVVRNIEIAITTITKEERKVLASNERLEINGEACVLATFIDITDRKRAEEKIQWQNQRLKALREIDTAILSADTVETIIGAALDHSRGLIKCQRAALALIDWGTNEMVVFDIRTVNETSIPRGIRIPLALFQDEISQTLSKNELVLINDLRLLTNPPPLFQSLIKEGLRSACLLPLFSQDNLMGAFNLSSEIPDFFDEEKIDLGREVANQVAIALTQNNLLKKLRDLNTDLEQRITERTSALSEANNLLQMLLDNMPDQIYFKDAQSRFIRNSRSQANALGLSDPAEAIGKSDFDFFPHAQISFDKEQEIIRSGKPVVDEEERVVWPDGQETWVSTTKVPLPDQDGKIIGTFGISRDITDRKQAEVALQKAKLELEAANKELGAFSYSVSHDLRSPLRTIDGFSQALLEDYADQLPAEGQDHLRRVRAATQRMGQLIDDLLNLSKVTRAPMKLVPVDLSGLAQGIVAELQRTQSERKVKVNIAPNLKVHGDPGLLQVVLENLLNNAWKFTAKQEQAWIEFGSKPEGTEIVYFIRDNGAGFDMAYVSKLFGAFQRLHAMTEFSGTGIGLATVQRIINRHGGRIWAEGAVDQGATFFFTLPALERAKPDAVPQEKDSLAKRAREII